MAIYFFTAGVESDELNELYTRIQARLPAVQKIVKLEDLPRPPAETVSPGEEQTFIIFPVLSSTSSLERLVGIAEQQHRGLFFIFVSRDISASDYKRLVRSGCADWVSVQGAPQEIEEIVSRHGHPEPQPDATAVKPTIASFVPSAGGVGNTTLVLEAAIQLKLARKAAARRICLLDLDLQASHVCDYLDIEARMQIDELVENPDRLDAQLFDLFVSRHSSGLDVLAAPRRRKRTTELKLPALDALFGMIAARYDLVVVDFPPQWFASTEQILSVSDVAVVTGLNTVPGLRQVAETLEAVRSVGSVPPRIMVALNRCEATLFGGIARRQHVRKVLGAEEFVTVRDDPTTAGESVNTGIPISVGNRSSKIGKDVQALAQILNEACATRS